MKLSPHRTGRRARRGSSTSAAVLCAVAGFGLTSSAASASETPRSVRFDRIQTVQGLPVDSVTCILQDRIGFLWIGTQDGLARFDGKGFVTLRHDPNDPETLPNDHIEALLEDAAGDLWIGSQRGLSRWHLDRGVFTHYLHDPEDPASIAGGEVQALFQDRSGALWVGTSTGLDRLDPASGRFEHFRSDPDDPASLSDGRIRAILEDSHGTLWVGTPHGLNRFDRAAGAFVRYFHDPQRPGSLRGNSVRSIYETRAGTLWLGTLRSGLHRFDRATATFEAFRHDPSDPAGLADDTVRVLREDRQGRLWIGTDSGLQLFLPSSETFQLYRHEPSNVTSLSADRVTAIYQDAGGVLWIGTQGGGLSRVTPTAWGFSYRRIVPTDPAHPISNDVLSLLEDGSGDLWIGTSGGGLHHIDPRTGASRHFFARPKHPHSLSGDRVSALLEDHRGTLWIGTLGDGLNRLDPGSREFRHYVADPSEPESLGSDGVMTLYEDRRRRLWIGTYGGGLNRFEAGTETFVRYLPDPRDPTSISSDQVTALAEDRQGNLWIGTFSSGLSRYSEDAPGAGFLNIRRDLSRATGLASDVVLSLHVDGNGAVWVGTDAGLHRLEGFAGATGEAVFRRFLERDGLPNDTIYGIHSHDGELWLSTNKGLSRFAPERESFKNYTAGHGLQANEFNMGAHFKGPSGKLMFGGPNGYNVFHPSKIERNAMKPPVVLTAFSKLNGEQALDGPIYALGEVRLDHEDSPFSFEFAALDFSSPLENQYRYMLEGWDDDWIDLGNHSRVTFSKIDPGSYVLKVKGSNNDAVWNDDGLALGIHIRPPFWRSWWFQLVTLLAAVAVIAHFLRARMVRTTAERLKVLVDERTRELEQAQEQLFRRKKLAVLGELAGSVAHELRNPLGAIKNSLYLLDLKTRDVTLTDAEGFHRYLKLIDEEIERSERIISELLDWGREAPADRCRFPLREIVRQAVLETAVPAGVEVDRRLDTDPLTVHVDPGQILRVLKNFLSNAIEAMPEGGSLRVECGRRGEHAVAEVVDTGVGISEDEISKVFEPLVSKKSKGVGLGLPLSQRYAERNGGRIECESRLGQGSTFRLVLPTATPEEEAEPEELAVAD